MGERLPISTAFAGLGLTAHEPAAGAGGEETMVVDARGHLRPAEMVERKLVTLLRAVPLPVSHVSASFRKR